MLGRHHVSAALGVFLHGNQALALRVIREAPPESSKRLRHLFYLCFSREPRAEELQRLIAFYKEQKARVQMSGADSQKILGIIQAATPPQEAAEAATFIALARVLMNLDEFINRE